MVLADEVNPVNEAYRTLSSRYKAGWTFHRFLQGLRTFFGSQDLDDRTGEFQELYKNLKEVSLRLNDLDIQPVVERMGALDADLDRLFEVLGEEERKVAPSVVRLFFQRVKTQDERILIDLVRFYLEAQRGRSWDEERIDKVDYLLSRLGEEASDVDRGEDRERLNRVLAGISSYHTQALPIDPQKVGNRLKLIEAVRGELEHVESFEELTEKDLVSHYRNVKHGLGTLLFEKSILPLVVSTNLLIASRVRELTDAAQEHIFGDYEKVSELEEQGLLTRDLSASVSDLHRKVGRFRKHMKQGTLRLDEMAGIREAVKNIFVRLDLDETPALEEQIGVGDPLAAEYVLPTAQERRILTSVYTDLERALRDSRRGRGETGGFHHRLLMYRLEPREIEAFTKLAESAKCDVRLEQFLLASASLRRKLGTLAREIKETGSLEAARRKQPPGELLRLADLYLRLFDHFLEDETPGEEPAAPTVRGLKMRLMREFAGLWLLVNGSS